MKIDFQSHIFDEYSSKEIQIVYEKLAFHHLELLKQQSKAEFFFWKIAGFFFLLIITALILQDKGFISNSYILIEVAGLGSLIVFMMNAKIDLELCSKAAEYVKRGINIENRQKFPGRIFQIHEDNKEVFYKKNLFNRISTFWFIGIGTAGPGIILSLQIGLWLAITVSLLSFSLLFLISRFHIKISKKILLENDL